MYPAYSSLYSQASGQFSPIVMTESVNIAGSMIGINVDINQTGNLSSSNYYVNYVVTREQSSDYFSSVVAWERTLVSQQNLNNYNGNIVIPIEGDWDLNACKVVIFVQSNSSNQIIGASTSSISMENYLSLSMTSIEIVNDDDGDGIANPYEQITLQIPIENASLVLSAQNLYSSISSDNAFNYTNLIDYNNDGSATEVFIANNLEIGESALASIDINLDMENFGLGVYNLDFTLEADYVDLFDEDYHYSFTFPIVLEISLNQSGFPYELDFEVRGSPLVIDFNNDGQNEIIFGDYSGAIHVLDQNGFELEGFPYMAGDQIWASAASGDLSGDGNLEFVITSKDNKVYVFDQFGLKTTYNSNSYLIGTPALGNLDDDPDLEIVFAGYSSSQRNIYVINEDGTDVAGFPLDIGEKTLRGVALADFDGNGLDDIVVGTDSRRLHLISDGAEILWSYDTEDKVQIAPVIVSYEDEKTIIAGCKDGLIYALNEDGTLRFSYTTENDISTSPSFAVVNEEVYMFFGNDDGMVYAMDLNGNMLENWPVSLNGSIVGSIVHADINGDLENELITVTDEGDLSILSYDTQLFELYPIINEFAYSGAPSLYDLDNDGDLEILAGTLYSINVIDIKGLSAIGDSDWSVHRGNNSRNGCRFYETSGTPDCNYGDVNSDSIIDILDIVLTVNIVMGNHSPNSTEICASDLNNDSLIDILDIVNLVNLILSR